MANFALDWSRAKKNKSNHLDDDLHEVDLDRGPYADICPDELPVPPFTEIEEV